MTNKEAEEQREAARKADSEREAKERAMSSKERAEETSQRNAERKEKKEQAADVLKSGSASSVLRDIAEQGGNLGRKLEREIRRFEQTGRVSNWLAGEAIKAESKQSAAQQSAFSKAVIEVVQTTPSAFLDLGVTAPPFLFPKRKPEVTQEVLQGGGGGTTCIGFALYTKTNESGNSEVWIGAGTVNGQLPLGFDPSDGKFLANSGNGRTWIEVEINQQAGEIASIKCDKGLSTPNNTATKFYYTLGYYEYIEGLPSVTNYGCGGLSVTICRNWFAAVSPFYGVTINR